jgi:DNA ligase (NAD+)
MADIITDTIDKLTMRDTINELNRLTKLYDMGTPEVSDKEWDDLYFSLEELEKKTGIIYPDSPTQSICFGTVSELEKVKHNHPMLSLDKTKSIDELKSFVSQGQKWFGMFKMDGLTCSLTYDEKGNLTKAETRGDGLVGENVFFNALVIPSIPRHIPCVETTVIDGEIICDIDTFEKYFSEEYKNPRNFASGSIRQLKSEETAKRKLTFVAWDLISGCAEIDSNSSRLRKLDDWGFITVPRVSDVETIEDAIEKLGKYRYSYASQYPIDGYVFKFESKEYGEKLGRTDHHFKNAIAYKFYDEEYETTLKRIDYDVSRNGILTPVAVFEPIDIDGSTVEKASMHNISIMEEILGENPYCGEKVWVYKANQIIPQISRADKRTEVKEENNIYCPICGGATSIHISDSGVKILMCDNPNCEGKLAQQIDHFCGKKGLDIKGISRKTIEKLIDWGWVNGFADIFRLEQHKTEWVSKAGFGEASVGKILSAVASARTSTTLESFISAIGIPLVGRNVSKEIVKYYPTWEAFRAAVGGDWTEFEGFGPEISKAINNFDYKEIDEIVELFISFDETEEDTQTEEKVDTLKDLVFVVTGKMSIVKNRAELTSIIENCGGKVAGSISSKTAYLINNDVNSTTQKNQKAKSLGIPIITEEDALKMCNYNF